MRRPPEWSRPRPGVRPGGHPSRPVRRRWPSGAARLARWLAPGRLVGGARRVVPGRLGARGGWWPNRRRGPGVQHPVLLGLGGLAVFVTLVWGTLQSSVLDIDHVEVYGSSQISAETAATVAGVVRGQPLMAVDPRRGEVLLEGLPWVGRARVQRLFPNSIRITLEERRAAAAAARPEGGFVLLDDSGRVLAESPQRPEGLPEVTGAGAPPVLGAWLPAARPMLRTVAALPTRLRRQVTAAAMAGNGVTLRLGAVPEVRFGPPSELPAKTAALVSLLERLAGRAVLFVDVQVPSAPVVGPIPAPAAAHSAAAAGPKPRD
jgi:cell division protein FtsQ